MCGPQNAFPGDIFAVNFTVRMNISDVEQKLKEILAQQLLVRVAMIHQKYLVSSLSLSLAINDIRQVPVETIGQVPGRRFIETVERASSSSQPLVQVLRLSPLPHSILLPLHISS